MPNNNHDVDGKFKSIFSTAERKFIVEYPDAPSWLIVDSFNEKFGWTPKRNTVCHIRKKERGSSNIRTRYSSHNQTPESTRERAGDALAAQTNNYIENLS